MDFLPSSETILHILSCCNTWIARSSLRFDFAGTWASTVATPLGGKTFGSCLFARDLLPLASRTNTGYLVASQTV